ncbi:hypothetical protein D8674_034406 [Pyrus ussuriensis x Pyrus communis]|uniref:Uncharacterized protein n=1 Tax=Pyrus ussuriensis x Pyrus communis TaxID=2448454 RepID=A0A5N5HTP0_9ROSA|nr:hypothetical protein D8674_034406 [Pyrus ussuriensis x Pyrus communis]
MRKNVLQIERYRRKRLPSFEDKSRVDAYAELRYDIGGLVQNQCSTEFKSWKMVLEELKKSMIGELSGVQNSRRSIVFVDVYVRPGEEPAESLHAMMMEKRQSVLQESVSQLPPNTPIKSMDPPEDAGFQILTNTLD